MAERPLIGITTGATHVPIPEGELDAHYVGRAYVRTLLAAGGTPILLPAIEGTEEELAPRYLDRVSGLLLSGGIDIAPDVYGGGWEPVQAPDAARDRLEATLVNGAVERGLPVLGVCRGMQMINVALGGSLHRHVEHTHVPPTDEGTFTGVRRHHLALAEGSLVRGALKRERIEVLCLHHQAPARVGEELEVSARADDGVVEAIELPDRSRFCLGVLWHPEHMLGAADLQSRLYGALVEAARIAPTLAEAGR